MPERNLSADVRIDPSGNNRYIFSLTEHYDERVAETVSASSHQEALTEIGRRRFASFVLNYGPQIALASIVGFEGLGRILSWNNIWTGFAEVAVGFSFGISKFHAWGNKEGEFIHLKDFIHNRLEQGLKNITYPRRTKQ